MSRRPPETLADYLAIAVCPFLIFLLVASLMFFLVEVFHEGEFKLRLQFVMAMFCMAIVCIARIAMEEGNSYATLYALPLGGAVAFVVLRLAPGGFWISLPLMGVVWWAAHKLTWDCTLVDDSQDASGQGLLQEMGLDPQAASVPGGQVGQSSPLSHGTTTRTAPASTTESAPEKSWWEKLLEPDRRPHAPGVWVVYFSLAALPLFGIGGWFVPASEPEARTRVFQYLVVYVASGLGLLLATSFLGLRKYLRQRNLEMPSAMAGTWVAVGAVLIAGTLIFAAILPRFRAEHSLSHVPTLFASAVRQASRFAIGPDGTSDDSNPEAPKTDAQENQSSEEAGGKHGDAKRGQSGKSKKSKGAKGKSDDSQGGGESQGGQSPGESAQGQGDQQGEKSDGDSSQGKSEQGETQKGGEQQGGEKPGGEKSPESEQPKESQQDPSTASQPEQPPPEPPPSQPSNFNIGSALFTLIKWLFWLAILIAAGVAGWFYREQLMAAWQKLLAELREFWARLFGQKPAAVQENALVELPTPPRPFAAFADPFANGEAARMPWPELVRYTFAAVEAWARERACPRHADQTPHEFAHHLAALEPPIAAPLQSLATWYAQLAYAPTSSAAGNIEPIRKLWRGLRQAAAAAPAA